MTRYSKTRKRYQGGTEIIGKGRFGTTYYPALQCLNPKDQPKGDVVSKVVPRKVARQEFTGTRILRQKNYDFTCHPIEACQGVGALNINGKKEEQWLLFSKYGGQRIAHHMYVFEEQARKFATMIGAMKDLREKIKLMNEKDKIFHNDVSVENMTYNEQDAKAYLIDFGEMSVGDQGGSDLLLFDQALVNIYHRVFSAIKEGGLGEEDWARLQAFYAPPTNNNNFPID